MISAQKRFKDNAFYLYRCHFHTFFFFSPIFFLNTTFIDWRFDKKRALNHVQDSILLQ